ncbi:MAG: TetR/AcrR family transcriptional regulator [Pseudomonadota bacterium]
MLSESLPEKAQAIAAAAIDAIHEKGLDRFKLTDVARKAGVTTGAVTYYFEDKDALLMAAFNASWQRLFAQVEAYEHGWRLERFINSLPTSEDRQRSWSVWLAFCGRAQTSEAISEHYRLYYARLETLLLESIERENDETARHDIRTVIAAMDGIGLCATLHPELWPAKRQQQCLRDMLGHLFPDGT